MTEKENLYCLTWTAIPIESPDQKPIRKINKCTACSALMHKICPESYC